MWLNISWAGKCAIDVQDFLLKALFHLNLSASQ